MRRPLLHGRLPGHEPTVLPAAWRLAVRHEPGLRAAAGRVLAHHIVGEPIPLRDALAVRGGRWQPDLADDACLEEAAVDG
eukprot:CAMPEP_0117498660 /NCGR_PEP_ID=MMETSP0784-20121206/21830_1 /TAXON_ID=39447 /ORGANISM="" /LENGTH=79 /DNA_ID=CAMNT_0005293755 /DNA_START=69 /DNA_END=308 /DNA_ORIENTATION=+